MSRSPDRGRRAVAVAVLTGFLTIGPGLAAEPGPSAWAQEAEDPAPADAVAPVEEITAPVEPIIAEVESEGGVVSVHELGETVTVAITSDVLFAFDRADLNPEARARLRDVAGQIGTDGAGGVVTIAGHTDDQGSDAYNDDLSLRRAESVRAALEGLLTGPDVPLPGVTLEAEGFGEREPRLPNVVDGQPIEENRARNRRVEIIFTAKQE